MLSDLPVLIEPMRLETVTILPARDARMFGRKAWVTRNGARVLT